MDLRARPWADVVVFLLLANAILVFGTVLAVTRAEFAAMSVLGQWIAGAVVLGCVAGVAGLATIVVRLYLQRVVQTVKRGGRRLVRPR